MLNEKVLSIEEIDAHIEAHKHLLTAAAPTATTICSVYTVARPALVFVKSLLGFFKPSWATVLQTLMTALDTSCNIKP